VAALLERLARRRQQARMALTGPTNMAGRAAAAVGPRLQLPPMAQTAAMVVAAAAVAAAVGLA